MSIEKHRFIKLIEFALQHSSFSAREAMTASGMSEREFSGAKYTLFKLKGEHESAPASETLNWHLSPQAFFQYLSFLQYRHAVRSSSRALWIAAASLAVATAGTIVSAIV